MHYFDVFGSALWMINTARGCKDMAGSKEEMQQLRNAGIKCHAPQYVGASEGDFIWGVKKRDFKRACKILGCG